MMKPHFWSFAFKVFARTPLACLLLITLSLPAAAKVIHKEKSLYRNIVVNQQADRRCLVFSVKRQMRNQTCIDTTDPKRIIFPYVRMTFAGLLANPAPASVLMIGMGGGTISNVLADIYPEIKMDLVEVDEAVVKVARQYFDFKESAQTQVHVIDGRVFTRRALLRKQEYDLIILDAFTGEYIPEHLMTLEFLQDIKSLLTLDGVVVANTFEGSALYDHESTTYAAVFGEFFNLRLSGTGNRVIIATKGELPDDATLQENARQLTPKFAPYRVEIMRYVSELDRDTDWDI